jgi:poly-gamma-glutamate synthesis protein (capsule biosynthesis protein)
MAVRIGLTGDVMLGRLVDEYQQRRRAEGVWGDVIDRLRYLDSVFVNLECCLSTRGEPWTETDRPFHFRADPSWAIPALERGNVDYCSLANNHVLDYEAVALTDTLEHLDDADIAHSGAGDDLSAALEPATLSVNGLDVACISLTDNTPEYAAEEATPGTAWIEISHEDPATRETVLTALERARDTDPDLVVASLHWGPNMRPEPPESFREFARWLVDQGVDVIHGHSAHVFQGIEIYDESPILYDLGDFVDDYAVDEELHNDRSFLFELDVTATGTPTRLRLCPTEIEECAVYEADREAGQWARERMRRLSDPFGTIFERSGDELLVDLDQ